MFSSIVQAGMRAITPRSSKGGSPNFEEKSNTTPTESPCGNDGAREGIILHNPSNSNNNPTTMATTPKGTIGSLSQATITTPSTVATMDVGSAKKDAAIEESASKEIGRNQDDSKKSNEDPGPVEQPQLQPIQTDTTGSTSANQAVTIADATADPSTTSVADLWQVLDRQLRSNIGTSVRCGICLSTVTNPVRTACAHGFCKDCITGYLRASRSDQCPECKAPCTRRSLEEFHQLDDLADAYKGMLRAFGLAPGTYRPEITTMTQKVDFGLQLDDDDDDDDNDEKENRDRFHRLCVSATYQHHGLPALRDTLPKLQVEENNQVVMANYEACFEDDGVDPETMDKLLAAASLGSGASGGGVLPNTQEVNEQAREQLEADRELQESMEAEELEQELAKQQQQQQHQTSLLLANEGSTEHKTHQDDDDHDDDDDCFVLRKQKPVKNASSTDQNQPEETFSKDLPKESAVSASNKKNPTDGAFSLSPSEVSPPIFARADTGSKRHIRKSFSKWDRGEGEPTTTKTPSPPKTIHASLSAALEEESLSPIEHENSFYWPAAADDTATKMDGNQNHDTKKEESSSSSLSPPNVTGMLEDSRGGLHMMPLSERTQGETVQRGDDSPLEEVETSFDGSDDKTIPMTADDEQTSSTDCIEEQEKDTDHAPENGDDGPPLVNYDPIQATQVTDELHESTKTEIDKAASLPAGPSRGIAARRQRPSKKILFAASANNDDGDNDTDGLDQKTDSKPKSFSRSSTDENGDGSSEQAAGFAKGTIVQVQSRTWPGVNKQGGVGRITARNSDGTYNVAYVLGGKESNVDAVFIEKEDQGESDSDEKGRRKRRAKEDDGLPLELLKQLAEEGFHVPGQKSVPGNTKKRKKPAVLSDATNSEAENPKRRGRKQAGTKADTATGSKRKSKSAFAEVADTSQPDASQQARSAKGKRKSKPQEPSASTKVATTDPPKKVKKVKKQVSWNVAKIEKFPSETKRSRPKKGSKVSFMPKVHELSNDDAIERADKRYRETLQDAIDSKLVTIASSNLGDTEKALLKSLCTKTLEDNVTIKTTEAINKKTTICIVPAKKDDETGTLRSSVRTLKVLRSALAGIPIVTPDWLRTCNANNKVVFPQNFIRSMPTKDDGIQKSGKTAYGVAKLAAAWNDEAKTPVLLPFRKTMVYLCGSYSEDKRKNMQNLLKAGGAKILSTPKDLSDTLKKLTESSSNTSSLYRSESLVVLCGDSCGNLPKSVEREIQGALELEVSKQASSEDSPSAIMVVDSQWVIESVTCAKQMPAALFEPKVYKKLWILSV